MASTFLSPYCFLFCLLLLFSIASPSKTSSLTANSSPLTEAEALIKGLNLHPKEAVNIRTGDRNSTSWPSDGKIVEWRLDLPVLGDSGSSIKDLGQHAGYYPLRHSHAARMFYFFFESRNSAKDPVVIWLTGGPGCSGSLALFYENGPFHIADNLTLESNLIFVDQPTGTGFSYSTDEGDIRQDEQGVSNDLYDFLQAFFEAHPQLVKNDFYITGESYAGHYIPAFAARVQQGNKAKKGIHINLKGFAIGNGLTDPEIQYGAYTDFALNMKLILQSDKAAIDALFPGCQQAIQQCATEGGDACESARLPCTDIFSEILDLTGNINYYDIRKSCEGSLCYDFSNVETLLNQKTVRDALGVRDIEFVSCSSTVYNAMSEDWMKNLAVGIPALLEDGLKVLIYAGEYDLICNWLGNSRWVHALRWSGRQQFGKSPNVPFVVAGAKAGLVKSHGPLTFLKVHNAGHMVPMDQPKAALQMLKSWMAGKVAVAGADSEIAT
ncbi:hypothetical protein BT93_J0547 [Corymbia citriodora subsp. variegata]|nr:hypothetical protein BT93_J0547 [Corymbia citriodora subsp. variegata]